MSSLIIKPKIINGVEYEDFMIGADPELRFKGMKARPHIPFEGKFGTDGPHSQVGELRPDPKMCPINLVYEIQNVMKKGYKDHKVIQDRDWLAGSLPDNQPLGGHIHVGVDARVNLERMLESLDKCLAPVSLMLEDEVSAASRRLNTSYGKLAKHNGKFNAGNRGHKTKTDYYAGEYAHPLNHDGFEYRPLSSWLTSRSVAAGTLSLAKVIAFEAHNKKLHRNLDKQLKFINIDRGFSSAYLTCDKRYFASVIPSIHRMVTTMKLFPFYEKYINYLFSMISQGKTWEEGIDIKKRWDIIPVKKNEKPVDIEKVTFNVAWDNALGNFENINIANTNEPTGITINRPYEYVVHAGDNDIDRQRAMHELSRILKKQRGGDANERTI